MTLDDISGGRLIAAIGAGGTGWDAQILGQEPLSPGERVTRLDEFVILTDLLLRQPDTTWTGRYFQARQAKMIPAGSRDRITLVVAAAGPRTIRIAARVDGWATTGPDAAGIDLDQWWNGVADLVRLFEQTDRRRARPRPGGDAPPAEPGCGTRPGNRGLRRVHRCSRTGRGAGFTDVVVHWPRPSGAYAGDDTLLDEIAGTLVDGSWSGVR